MNIAVDATIWQNNRGYGRHARALLTALAKLELGDRLTFFVDSLDQVETMPENVTVWHVPSSQPASIAAGADGHRSLSDIWKMSRALSSSKFDDRVNSIRHLPFLNVLFFGWRQGNMES